MVVYHTRGIHEIPVSEFFLGPGRTALGPGEWLLAVRFPVPPEGGCGRYLKLGRTRAGDLAVVGVAVFGWPVSKPAGENAVAFRIGLASVAPVPMRARMAEEVLAGHPSAKPAMELAAAEAANSTSPIDDVRASGSYRKAMVRNLVLRGVRDVAEAVRRGTTQQ
jgi:CO/xanthine dehydrogenase FAD-binding subunit